MTVQIQFNMSQETWDTVVNDSLADEGNVAVVSEDTDFFIVEYENQDCWNNALHRFQGCIEYIYRTPHP